MTLANRENQAVPDVEFRLREDGEWTSVRSAELFRDKTVVVFALPGAFTPTCSSSHVPRYQQLAPTFHAHGVDDIVCLSVNDAFVMDAWRKEEGADRIRFIPDGNGEFTTAMGMMVDKGDLGFGARSWRYSMLVRDGVIEKMFIEPEVEGDPYGASDADTMLRYVAEDARVPPSIVLFTKPGCSFCVKAKRRLQDRGLEYEEIVSTQSMRLAVSGLGTTPQVFVDGKHLGGADELDAWFTRGDDTNAAHSDAA
ncbi:MAG: glutathione peroxidase [Polyangiales bacterium]